MEPMAEVDAAAKRTELIQGGPVRRELAADQCALLQSGISGRQATFSPEDARSHRQHDQTMLWIAVALIAVSLLLLRRNGSEGVQLGWPPIELPQLCASRVYFGVECPGCGVTRS